VWLYLTLVYGTSSFSRPTVLQQQTLASSL
jgi:hypothetical protein